MPVVHARRKTVPIPRHFGFTASFCSVLIVLVATLLAVKESLGYPLVSDNSTTASDRVSPTEPFADLILPKFQGTPTELRLYLGDILSRLALQRWDIEGSRPSRFSDIFEARRGELLTVIKDAENLIWRMLADLDSLAEITSGHPPGMSQLLRRGSARPAEARDSRAARLALEVELAAKREALAVLSARLEVASRSLAAFRDRRAPGWNGPDFSADFSAVEPIGVDERGWSILPIANDARIIYVSSSRGDDGFDGLSEAQPKQTIAAGKALLRDGYPDRLLLRRGDVFYEVIGILEQPGEGPLSGRSRAEPMLFGAYGKGARPLLKIGAETGIQVWDGKYDEGNRSSNFIAVVGLHFYAQTRDPESPEFEGIAGGMGFYSRSRGRSVLIEDCRFDYCGIIVFAAQNNGDPDPRFEDLRIRRSVIYGNYSNGGHAQGLFVDTTDGILIEGCVFDHNGWNELVGAKRTIFNHNIYITTYSTGLIARGNIIARGSSSGIQARPGGVVENNLFVGNATQINFGWVWGSPPLPGGVTGRVVGNIILDGTMVNPDGNGSEQALYGIKVGNIRQGTVADNVVVRTGALDLAGKDYEGMVGINNLVLRRNKVASEEYAIKLSYTGFVQTAIVQNLLGGEVATIRDLDGALAKIEFSQNEQRLFVLLREIGYYHALFGGGPSLESFLEEARQQSEQNWRWLYDGARLTQWLRRRTER